MSIIIFTDGSSRGNPGPGGWGAVIVRNSSENPKSEIRNPKVVELGGREEKTTNNRMELKAVIESLKFLSHVKSHMSIVTIYSDSSYVIKGITQWVSGWMRNDWKTSGKQDVANRDLWEELVEVSGPFSIDWQLLPGHSGIPGNERADVIATKFADEEDAKLYNGPITEYALKDSIQKVSINRKLTKKKKNTGKAYSYLSLVDGITKRHKDWESTKSRVEGKKGVKYRKALSLEHEKELLNEWGVSEENVKDA